jgi:ferrous iron transport protein A
MLLSSVKPKGTCRIKTILETTQKTTRLSELGVVKGEVVTVLSVAPLGDPIRILIKGYQLALRKSEAKTIEVESL